MSLPVEPRHYHHFYRTPFFAGWRPVVAILVGFLGMLLGSVIAVIPTVVDMVQGRVDVEQLAAGMMRMTPMALLCTNLSLAVLIPVGMLCQRWFFAQRGGWLSSVVGRLRWRWLALSMVVLVPLWFAAIWLQGIGAAPQDSAASGQPSPHWVAYLVILALTTPLQSAGEEYGFRGLVNRAVAGWFADERVALVAGTVVSSALFALAHGPGDLWAALFYFGFGVVLALLVWRTGGLEAAIVLHSVNNLIAFGASVLTGEIDQPMQLSGVTGSPVMLLPLLAGLLILGIIEWWRRRWGVQITAAPGQQLIADEPVMAGPAAPGQHPPAPTTPPAG